MYNSDIHKVYDFCIFRVHMNKLNKLKMNIPCRVLWVFYCDKTSVIFAILTQCGHQKATMNMDHCENLKSYININIFGTQDMVQWQTL